MMIASAPFTAGAQSVKAGIDFGHLDRKADPAEDFYRFACGGWQDSNPLPAAYSRFGTFDQLQEDNNKRINTILGELLKKKYKDGTTERKLSDLYKLAMDSVRRNKEGVSPVMPLIGEMEAAGTTAELKAIQEKYAAMAYGVPYGTYFGADDKNANMNILNVYQGGLTLGQKEYYLDNDSATAEIREAYKGHIERMFGMFGFTPEQARAKREAVMQLETAIALISKNRTELRDVEANYNKMTLGEFKAAYPNIDLERLLNAEGVASEHIGEMVVGQPAFLAGVDKLLAVLPAENLKAVMQWDAINSAVPYLGDDVQAANFDFFGKAMTGRKEDYPRWKKATSQVQGMMGEALGKIYCDKYFPASSKAKMETLVANLQKSLGERIMAQDWMSDQTKKAAMDKLSSFYVKIGYPGKWKDMAGLEIDPAKSYYENIMACRLFHNARTIKERVGKPVDKTEWHMTPQTVNAYYNPTTNEICFPAGILQKPFFDPKADEAFNYGAIGVVIGHEMTHGFDDQGRHYDKDGNMSDWWTEQDAENFGKKAKEYAAFFSNIKVLPDLNANGDFTLGENLADHGGLEVAFHAYKAATAGKKLKDIEDTTPDQRFFLAYAGVWAGNITDKEIRSRTKSDPHSLGKWRVNGALPHIDAWYGAFNVKEGDAMYIPASQRLKLW